MILNQVNRYGAASRYDFNNPSKWVTIPNVPLLDEHLMTGEDGEPITYVGKRDLEEIAYNNNKRVVETGDPATIILGHTSDDPRAPEKPAKGFVVNYKVKPFKRDPKTGQLIYAVHGDYKIRPKNAHLVEEYPRRSVELWWNKKEIDPIAMLGGTTPERDLSVVLRKSRFFHVALLGGTVPERDLTSIVRFSRRGNNTIEHYAIEGLMRFEKGKGGKVEKVMHEFKHGELHSGSKKGPKVTNRDQALAIAMSEEREHKAGKRKYADNENGDPGKAGAKNKTSPMRGNKMENPKCYEAEDENDPSDGGGEYSGDGMEMNPDMGDGDGEMDAERDPMLAKVFQSQQWKTMQQQLEGLTSQIGDLLQTLQQGGEGQEGMGGPGGGMEGAGGEPPMEGDEGEGGTPSEGMEDQEEREMHGEHPVQFGHEREEDIEGFHGHAPHEADEQEIEDRPFKHAATGFAGPMSTNIPNIGNGTSGNRYSRSKNGKGNSMPTKNRSNDQVVRLQRQVEALTAKLATADAEKIVNQLEGEGIVFGDSLEEHNQGKQDEAEFLSLLDDESRMAHTDTIRKRYKRRQVNPSRNGGGSHGMMPGVARYTRASVGNGAGIESNIEDPNEFDPQSPQEASDFADLVAVKKMDRAAAVKAIKMRRAKGAYPASNANMSNENFGV